MCLVVDECHKAVGKTDTVRVSGGACQLQHSICAAEEPVCGLCKVPVVIGCACLAELVHCVALEVPSSGWLRRRWPC